MKTIKIILWTVIGLLAPNTLFAQNSVTTINSVQFNQKYSQAQIETLWGKPTKFEHAYGEVEVYDYFYIKDNLGFDAKFNLIYFDLVSDKFKINGVVGVGDSVSKFSQLPNRMKSEFERNSVMYLYDVYDSSSEALIVFHTRNQIIYRITYDNLY